MSAALMYFIIVVAIALLATGYALGYRQGRGQNLEVLRRKAQRRLAKAKAETDFLSAAAPPRVRQAKIRPTARRSTQAGPDE